MKNETQKMAALNNERCGLDESGKLGQSNPMIPTYLYEFEEQNVFYLGREEVQVYKYLSALRNEAGNTKFNKRILAKQNNVISAMKNALSFHRESLGITLKENHLKYVKTTGSKHLEVYKNEGTLSAVDTVEMMMEEIANLSILKLRLDSMDDIISVMGDCFVEEEDILVGFAEKYNEQYYENGEKMYESAARRDKEETLTNGICSLNPKYEEVEPLIISAMNSEHNRLMVDCETGTAFTDAFFLNENVAITAVGLNGIMSFREGRYDVCGKVSSIGIDKLRECMLEHAASHNANDTLMDLFGYKTISRGMQIPREADAQNKRKFIPVDIFDIGLILDCVERMMFSAIRCIELCTKDDMNLVVEQYVDEVTKKTNSLLIELNKGE